MKPSEIRLEEFNNCPGQDILRELHGLKLSEGLNFRFVDLPAETYPYWQNDSDTFVVAFAESFTRVALALGKVAVEWSADEFDWRFIEDQFVVRLWWD